MKITGKPIRPAATVALGGCCLLLFLFPRPLTAGKDTVRRFARPGDFATWKGEGIEAVGSGAGDFQIRAGAEFRIFSPPRLGIPAEKGVYLRIRLRIQSPRYFHAFRIGGDGQPVLVPAVIQPPLDNNFHTFWLPLTKAADRQGTIEALGLIFGGRPGWVEIDSIEIRPFSTGLYLRDQWRELLSPRSLTPGTINGLISPRLFKKNLAYYLNLVALALVLVPGFWWWRSREPRRGAVAAVAAGCLLILWGVSDLRETLEQFRQIKEIHSSFLLPPEGEKTFPALGDFYQFAEFCRERIPPESVFATVPYPYWPYDVRLKNLLYPVRMVDPSTSEYLAGEYPRYLVVYHRPDFIFDPSSTRIYSQSEGRTVSGPGRLVARYDQASFIFREEAQ